MSDLPAMNGSEPSMRPADVCRALLSALDAADGRRKQRKRDQTPDTIGLHIKRELLDVATRDNPDPQFFDQWLLDYVDRASPELAGATLAMAQVVSEEWRLALRMREFAEWLARGAPSADASAGHPETSAAGR